jgi:hypothetical protein
MNQEKLSKTLSYAIQVSGTGEKDGDPGNCHESSARGIWYFAALESPSRGTKRALSYTASLNDDHSHDYLDVQSTKKSCVREAPATCQEQPQEFSLADNQDSLPCVLSQNDNHQQSGLSSPCASIHKDGDQKTPPRPSWEVLSRSAGFLSPSSVHPIALDADELGLYWTVRTIHYVAEMW